MQNETLSIVGIVIALATALGLGTLIPAVYSRYIKKHDEHDDLHEANRGKELDAVSGFQERLIHRVDNLETEINVLRTEQLAQARINERLAVENDGLKKDNLRQAEEIKVLQDTVQRLQTELDTLSQTQLEVAGLIDIETANGLRAEALSIIENIGHISFVSTDDPPNEQDASWLRRFKEMKASAKKMQESL